MPLLDLGADVIANTKAKASVANAKWNAIKTLLNVTKLDHENIQDLAIITALLADGAVTGVKLDPALLAALGANDGTNVRRGKSIIATEEIRSNTAYGLMTTPDRVQSIVLPTNGLIRVAFQAMTKDSVGSAGRAAIFIGANQLDVAVDGAPAVQEAPADQLGVPNTYAVMGSFSGGLATMGDNNNAYAGDVTTGQAIARVVSLVSSSKAQKYYAGATLLSTGELLGGVCTIFAAAGTYDISVQFKASSGSVTTKNRKLWVEAVGF